MARAGGRKGLGRKPKLVFSDRLLVTLVLLRHQLPHAVLAELFAVDRSTVSEAVRQVRPLLAACGFAVPDRVGLRLKTLEDVFAHAEAAGVELRMDGARPRSAALRRDARATGRSSPSSAGRTPSRPPRSAAARAACTNRPPCAPRASPSSSAPSHGQGPGRLRYQGLAKEFPDQVSAPPKKPADEACDGDKYIWQEARRRQCSARICVEHTNAELPP